MVDVWEGDSEGTRRYSKHIIEKTGDWERLPILDPGAPHLSAQLACLRLIRSLLGPQVPILQTIFSPLAQAKNLVGKADLIAHLRQAPEAVIKGLEIIAETTRRFVEAALETGIDGIFYAIQHAQAGLLSLEEYQTFGLPHDRMVMEPASGLWCNMLHLHGLNIHFDLVHDLSFPIVNWHDRETSPSLQEARGFAGSPTLCGGINQKTILFGDSSDVRKEAADAIARTGGRRFILGTGCVTPVIAPHGNLLAARQSVEKER